MSRTKILATIGPASASTRIIEAMLRAGACAFRLNFSHGDEASHAAAIAAIRRAAKRARCQPAILGDLPGPKIRLGPIPDGTLSLEEGRPFYLTPRSGHGGPDGASVRYARLLRDIRRGDRIALNDGAVFLRVEAVAADRLKCVVESAGEISSNKGVNFPGVRLGVFAPTSADRRWIRFAVAHRLDFLALSFVRRAADIRAARRAVRSAGGDIPIVAKIEKHEAVEEMEAIVAGSDGAMAARGDLGVEIPIEQTPLIQKRLIRLCNRASKPVITATQMLESMIVASRPTRAEVSDVANAILDGTDALMLSAETAAGRHPVEAVAVMERIARAAEPALREVAWFGAAAPFEGPAQLQENRRASDFDTLSGVHPSFHRMAAPSPSRERSARPFEPGEGESSKRRQISGALPSSHTDDAIALAAVRIARSVGAAAILCCTTSGSTALRVARHRPVTPIIAVSQTAATIARLQLTWGVRALLLPPRLVPRRGADVEAVLDASARAALHAGLLQHGDTVVATAGAPLYIPGNTNLIRVIEV